MSEAKVIKNFCCLSILLFFVVIFPFFFLFFFVSLDDIFYEAMTDDIPGIEFNKSNTFDAVKDFKSVY